MNQVPRTPGSRRRWNQEVSENGGHPTPQSLTRYTSYPFHNSPLPGHAKQTPGETIPPKSAASRDNQTLFMTSPPSAFTERHALKTSRSGTAADRTGNYGSTTRPGQTSQLPDLPSLALPDPALDPKEAPSSTNKSKKRGFSTSSWKIHKKNIPYLRRAYTKTEFHSPNHRVPAEAYAELDAKQQAFFKFLDHELAKIEAFYKLKEEEATDRLGVLREQLHVMRDRGFEEAMKAKKGKDSRLQSNSDRNEDNEGDGKSNSAKWKKPIKGALGRGSRQEQRAKILENMMTPPGPVPEDRTEIEARQDFVRRAERDAVPYRTAKRKLKLALKEFYRGLELLKAYVDLNRKAFRKINKKYDRATNSRPAGRYVSEKVNHAWFVQSDIIENHLVAVEDLYTRYFERGNRKNGVAKLRGKTTRSDDYSPSTFRNGLLLAAGSVFGLQGLVYAIQLLSDPEPTIRSQTSFLLQVSCPVVDHIRTPYDEVSRLTFL